MDAHALAIADVWLLQPQLFHDERGFFVEDYNQNRFEQTIGRSVSFVQDNQSFSHKNVLRGLHYQTENCQGKLVRVLQGEVFDVAVDMRESSPTFGQWVGEILSAENRKQLWIPEGFAHGFLVLSPQALLLYKVTDYYNPKHDHTLIWDDREIGINWPLQNNDAPILSPKDKMGNSIKNCVYL